MFVSNGLSSLWWNSECGFTVHRYHELLTNLCNHFDFLVSNHGSGPWSYSCSAEHKNIFSIFILMNNEFYLKKEQRKNKTATIGERKPYTTFKLRRMKQTGRPISNKMTSVSLYCFMCWYFFLFFIVFSFW